MSQIHKGGMGVQMKTEKSYNFFPKKGEEGRGSKSLNFSLFEGVPKKDIITIMYLYYDKGSFNNVFVSTRISEVESEMSSIAS